MAVTVYIPTPFRRATANRDRIDVSAPDVAGLLDELERAYGGLKGLVRNEPWRGASARRHLRQQRADRRAERSGHLARRTATRSRSFRRSPAAPGRAAVILTAEEREAVESQAVEEYPHESCGVILSAAASGACCAAATPRTSCTRAIPSAIRVTRAPRASQVQRLLAPQLRPPWRTRRRRGRCPRGADATAGGHFEVARVHAAPRGRPRSRD